MSSEGRPKRMLRQVSFKEVGAGTSWSEEEKMALATLLVEERKDPSWVSEGFFARIKEEGKVCIISFVFFII